MRDLQAASSTPFDGPAKCGMCGEREAKYVQDGFYLCSTDWAYYGSEEKAEPINA